LTARENVEFVMQIQGVPAHKRGEPGRSRPAGPGRPATRRHVRRSATACRRRTGNCVPAGAGVGG
jgi:hypothetical protein